MAVYVRVSGGLGNQLFQLAAGAVAASDLRTDLVMDPSGIYEANRRGTATRREFALPEMFPTVNVLATERTRLNPMIQIALLHGRSPFATLASDLAYLLDSRLGGRQSLFRDQDITKVLALASRSKARADVHLNGYWADFRIAEKSRNWILSKMFTERALSSKLQRIEAEMKETRSTSVHVRRGDFLSKWGSIHDVTSGAYFAASMDSLAPATDKFYVFSDDIEWCRTNLRRGNKDIEFITRERGESDMEHLLVMSKAKDFIISNSSFSWWAAWLGSAKNKRVLRPFAWTTNNSGELVYPADWERVLPDDK